MIVAWDYIVVIGERMFNGVHQQQIRIVPID
jgi:hypothetical protein